MARDLFVCVAIQSVYSPATRSSTLSMLTVTASVLGLIAAVVGLSSHTWSVAVLVGAVLIAALLVKTRSESRSNRRIP